MLLIRQLSHRHLASQKGSVFTVLIAGVAAIGVLGVSAYNLLSGPIKTASDVTARNTTRAELVTATSSLASTVETTERRVRAPVIDAGFNFPAGGGHLPTDIPGLKRTDPFGRLYGYCAWEFGTTSASNPNYIYPSVDWQPDYKVAAIISAGSDGVFQTTCANLQVSAAGGTDDNPRARGDDVAQILTLSSVTSVADGSGGGGGGVGDIFEIIGTDLLQLADPIVDFDVPNTLTATNVNASGQITGGELNIGGGAATIDASGNINTAGTISGGTITGTSLNASGGPISGGAITGTSLNASGGPISGGDITASGTLSGNNLTIGGGNALITAAGAITGQSLTINGSVDIGDASTPVPEINLYGDTITIGVSAPPSDVSINGTVSINGREFVPILRYGSVPNQTLSAGDNATQAGERNLAIGDGAGESIAGNDNVVLGRQAGNNLTTASNSIIIGSQVEAADAITNYQLNIGNLLAGILPDDPVAATNNPNLTVAGDLIVRGAMRLEPEAGLDPPVGADGGAGLYALACAGYDTSVCVRMNSTNGSATCRLSNTSVTVWSPCPDAFVSAGANSGPWVVSCAAYSAGANVACTRMNTTSGATSTVTFNGVSWSSTLSPY